jgi:hypothetical protein
LPENREQTCRAGPGTSTPPIHLGGYRGHELAALQAGQQARAGQLYEEIPEPFDLRSQVHTVVAPTFIPDAG